MKRVIEAIVPTRLGRDFRWLLSSSWVTNLGDGLAVAAGPLLIASQTRDPQLVAMALLLQWLPFLLFGLYAGAIADRIDRRRIVVVVDLLRAAVLAVLSVTIWTGRVNVVVVLVTVFLLGVAETFADTTTSTLLPMMVGQAGPRDRQQPADGRAGHRQPAGRAADRRRPVRRRDGVPVRGPGGAGGPGGGARLPDRPDAPVGRGRALARRPRRMGGVRWLWRHPPVRTLAITITVFNVTFGAAWSVLVLLAIERLEIGEVGYGLMITVGALGGLLGTVSYGWLERHFSLANIMRVGLIIETATHLVLATTTTAWVAMVTLFAFGVHEFVWGTTATAVRQRVTPTEFQGRVGSVYRMGVYGGLVIGAALGGMIAARWGVTAPFWFAFAGSAIILVLIWRQLELIAHAEEVP